MIKQPNFKDVKIRLKTNQKEKTKGGITMSSVVTAKLCPKKAYAAFTLSPGISKTNTVRSNINDILSHVFPTSGPLIKKGMTEKKIDDIIDTVFANSKAKMYDFEAEAESQRAKILINRMYEYLRGFKYEVVDSWFSESVTFLGKKHEKTVHLLVKSKDHYKAIQFKYKAPEIKYSAPDRQLQAGKLL